LVGMLLFLPGVLEKLGGCDFGFETRSRALH
jgi:hypothetical protein